MNDENDIERIVADHTSFNHFLYTPLHEAIAELHRRWNDKTIPDIEGIPEILKSGFKAVLFRHIATPNYEVRRFMSIDDAMPDLHALILEYPDDIFTNSNEWKYSLGKISLYKGHDRMNGIKTENMSIIDFNMSNGKPLLSIQTLWGQSLVDFHHELFLKVFKNGRKNMFDLSEWIQQNGKSAKNYYKSFFQFFIKNGILFDNFLLNEQEISFTKEVVLPSFIEATKKTGLKPLIVSLEPTNIEESNFWLCHPIADKQYIKDRVKSGKTLIQK